MGETPKNPGLGIPSGLQWSHTLIWATFGFLIIIVLSPVCYSFWLQVRSPDVLFHEHLLDAYSSFFGLEWLVISSLALSVVLGVYSQYLLADFSNFIYWIDTILTGKDLRKEREDLKNEVVRLLCEESQFKSDRLWNLSIAEFRGLFTGGEEALAPQSYLAFYIWARENRKDLTLQEFRFYTELFRGIKGLMLLISCSFFSFMIFTLIPCLPPQSSMTALPIISFELGISVIFFLILWRGADRKMKDYRTSLIGGEQVLFTQWVNDTKGGEILNRELAVARSMSTPTVSQ